MFRVGQKVVCIKDGKWSASRDTPHHILALVPKYRKVYRIVRMDAGQMGYLLLGLEGFDVASGFLAENFRPIVSTSKKSERQKIIDGLLSDAPKVDA